MPRVIFSDDAAAQIDTLDQWWREHRLRAPVRFAQELESALRLLGEMPAAGVTVDLVPQSLAAVLHPDALAIQFYASVRRLVLSTGHSLYYVEQRRKHSRQVSADHEIGEYVEIGEWRTRAVVIVAVQGPGQDAPSFPR